MPISPFYSNPDYAGPDQVAQQRAYAEYLTKNQMPVTGHWSQGAANMVSQLMGGLESRRADQMQSKSRQMEIANILAAISPQQQQAAPVPTVGPSFGGDTQPSNDAARYAQAISGIESGGKYD